MQAYTCEIHIETYMAVHLATSFVMASELVELDASSAVAVSRYEATDEPEKALVEFQTGREILAPLAEDKAAECWANMLAAFDSDIERLMSGGSATPNANGTASGVGMPLNSLAPSFRLRAIAAKRPDSDTKVMLGLPRLPLLIVRVWCSSSSKSLIILAVVLMRSKSQISRRQNQGSPFSSISVRILILDRSGF